MNKKVLLTATVQSHIAQFHKPLILMLKENGYEVHVAARDNLAEKNGLQLNEPDKVFNISFDRSPLSKNNIAAYRDLNRILSENKYDVVHCNTPMGGIVTRLAANKYRKIGTKVFYTAHGFHFYKGSPKKNWIVYYPIEKFFARFTDKIITITKEDYDLATSKFKAQIIHTHGVGANSRKFSPLNDKEIKQLRNKFNFENHDFVLLCTGELNKNKNQSFLINSMALAIKKDPSIKLLLAGNGPLENKLKDQVLELNLDNNVIFLGYRTDLQNFTNAANAIISVSKREGLPLNIIEGMLCKKPIIASSNRGHNELIINDYNGIIISTSNELELANRVLFLKNNPDYVNKIKNNAHSTALNYAIDNVIEEMKEIYEV